MWWIRVRIWGRQVRALAVVAASILIITATVCFGPDTIASALVEHLESFGPRATDAGRAPVPGVASASYAVAIRATQGPRRAMSRCATNTSRSAA